VNYEGRWIPGLAVGRGGTKLFKEAANNSKCMIPDTIEEAKTETSDQFRDIHGHFIDLSSIVLLDITEDSNVIISHKVDRNSFSTESTRSSNSMNVKLSVGRQVVVDHQRDLLHVNSSSPDVRSNQDTTRRSQSRETQSDTSFQNETHS